MESEAKELSPCAFCGAVPELVGLSVERTCSEGCANIFQYQIDYDLTDWECAQTAIRRQREADFKAGCELYGGVPTEDEFEDYLQKQAKGE